MEEHKFLLKHSQEFSEKYTGKYITIVGSELVAISDSGVEVFKKTKEKYPERQVYISYMPTTEEMVTL